jgi:hypothetical protein
MHYMTVSSRTSVGFATAAASTSTGFRTCSSTKITPAGCVRTGVPCVVDEKDNVLTKQVWVEAVKYIFGAAFLTDLFPTSPLSLQRNKMAFASRLVLSLHSNPVLIFIDTTVLLPLV